jgi:hypothetical protein
LRAILARRDVRDSSLALNDAVYFIPRTAMAAERDALLAALAQATPNRKSPPYRVDALVVDQVVAWPRAEVLELSFDDGLLHLARRPGGGVHVAFQQGKDVRWMDLKPSKQVDSAWRAHADAVRRKGTLDEDRSWAERPLERMRDIGIDYR